MRLVWLLHDVGLRVGWFCGGFPVFVLIDCCLVFGLVFWLHAVGWWWCFWGLLWLWVIGLGL